MTPTSRFLDETKDRSESGIVGEKANYVEDDVSEA